MQKFLEQLKEYGLKATPQRIEILSVINRYGHANIDEIYEATKKSHPSISLATVYKNIISLVEKSLLKEVALNSFKTKYEINKDKHAHLICNICGSIEDVSLNDIKLDASNIIKNKNFKSQNIELNLYGVCSKCSS